MSALTSLFKLLLVRQVLRKPIAALSCPNTPIERTYADTSADQKKPKNVTQIQGTENEERIRVRRARPADVPRVLRFVREHSRTAWPGAIAPPSASHLVICDYVARALSQGHSMLAEQQESRRGWSQIRGLALSISICPWDAMMLEKWARCLRCSRSRRLMHFTAHCLRAPGLHDKYRVHNVLQVILIIPHDCPKNAEIVHVLAKNAIQRGKDVGFPVLRFDVTDSVIAEALEALNLKKEWQLSYDAIPDAIRESDSTKSSYEKEKDTSKQQEYRNYIAVYTACTDKN